MDSLVVSVASDPDRPVRCLLTDVVDHELCVSALPVSARVLLGQHPRLVGKSLSIQFRPKDRQDPPRLVGVVTRTEQLPDQFRFTLKLRSSDWAVLAGYWAREMRRAGRRGPQDEERDT